MTWHDMKKNEENGPGGQAEWHPTRAEVERVCTVGGAAWPRAEDGGLAWVSSVVRK